MLISSEQSNASTQTLYQKIRLKRLIQHIKLYAHNLLRCVQREDRSSMLSFQLSDGVLYYRIPITSNTSIIGSIKYNCLLSFLSVTEKSKQNFPITHSYLSTGLPSKIHRHWMNVEELMNF